MAIASSRLDSHIGTLPSPCFLLSPIAPYPKGGAGQVTTMRVWQYREYRTYFEMRLGAAAGCLQLLTALVSPSPPRFVIQATDGTGFEDYSTERLSV